MRKLTLFLFLFSGLAMAQYFPPLGGGSSGGSVTVNGVTCTIGSSCTVTGAPSGAAGGDLTGTYPNPTIATVNAGVGTFGSATQSAVVVANAKGQITGISNVTIAGVTPAGSAGGVLSGTYPNPGFAADPAFTRIFVPGTSGTASQGYYTGTLATPLGAFQSLDLGGITYSFFVVNKHYTGAGWVDNGAGRLGSAFTLADDSFVFNSIDAGTGFSPRFAVASSGNMIVGSSTDGNYKLDVQKSGSAGTARFYDQTGVTGVTLVTITPGASQTATSVTSNNGGTTKSAGYQSSDGSAGVTVTTCTGFKNGLCVAGT